jgi:type II secretory pathway component PulL
VIDRAWLTAALDWLRAHHRAPHALVCEADAVEAAKGEWVVSPGVPHGFLRRDDGFVVHLDAAHDRQIPFALTLALNEARNRHQAPSAVVVETASASDAFASWPDALQTRLRVTPPAGQRPARLLAAARDRNLLTGAFAPRMNATPLKTALQRVGRLVAAMAALHLVFTLIDNSRMDTERRAIEARLAETFRSVFPDAQTIVDAPLQMSRKLAQLQRERGVTGDDAPRATIDRLAAFAARGSGLDSAPEVMSLGIEGGVASIKLRVVETADLKVLMDAASKLEGATVRRVDEPSARQTIVSMRIAP